jgi:hypothetical protein
MTNECEAEPKTAPVLLALALVLISGCDKPADQTTRVAPTVASRASASALVVAEVLPAGFTSATAQVNGTGQR